MHQPRDNIKYCATLMRNRVNIAGVMKIGSRKQFINGTCRGAPVANQTIIGRTPSDVPGKAKECERVARSQSIKYHGCRFNIKKIHLNKETPRLEQITNKHEKRRVGNEGESHVRTGRVQIN